MQRYLIVWILLSLSLLFAQQPDPSEIKIEPDEPKVEEPKPAEPVVQPNPPEEVKPVEQPKEEVKPIEQPKEETKPVEQALPEFKAMGKAILNPAQPKAQALMLARRGAKVDAMRNLLVLITKATPEIRGKVMEQKVQGWITGCKFGEFIEHENVVEVEARVSVAHLLQMYNSLYTAAQGRIAVVEEENLVLKKEQEELEQTNLKHAKETEEAAFRLEQLQTELKQKQITIDSLNQHIATLEQELSHFRAIDNQGTPAVQPAPAPAVQPEPAPAVQPEPTPAVQPEPQEVPYEHPEPSYSPTHLLELISKLYAENQELLAKQQLLQREIANRDVELAKLQEREVQFQKALVEAKERYEELWTLHQKKISSFTMPPEWAKRFSALESSFKDITKSQNALFRKFEALEKTVQNYFEEEY